jgi:hypothetical protein
MMTRFPLGQLKYAGLAVLLAMAIAGCSGLGGFRASDNQASAFRDRAMSMQNASDAVVVGQSTKEDVGGVLGPATVVKFDSEFEVWLYRASPVPDTATPAEFVILFAPSGVVKKTRLLPPSGARANPA